jgi:TRAP-type mannitol/chloroaromatic compound transport system permease small subunit
MNIIIQILSNIFFLTPFCIVSKWNNSESILAEMLLHQEFKTYQV